MTKQEQILALAAHFAGGGKSAFGRLVGASPSTVSTWLRRGAFPVRVLAERLPGVNPAWLLTGEGEMLLEGAESSQDAKDAEVFPAGAGDMEREPEVETRPHLPVFAAAGRLCGVSDGVSAADCPRMAKLPGTPDYDFTITVSGDSMLPRFESGDILAVRRVWDMVEWGKPHVVDTREGAVLKKVYEDGADRLRLVSYNPEYPPMSVDRESVLRLFRVVAALRPSV